MKTTSLTLALAVAALMAGCGTVERSRSLGDPAVPGRVLAQQVCSNCHGPNGNAESPNFPNLAAQQELYFAAQLKGFRGHSRSDPAGFEYMWGLSKHLTDDQISGLAAYYAAQKPVAIHYRTGNPALADEGKAIFEKGISDKAIPPCSTCHGAEGQGNAIFPRLAGQHADYLVKQLRVFQRTDERPEGGVMKEISHLLTSENMEAVASYLEAFSAK